MHYVPQNATFEIRTKFLGEPHWGPQNLFLATMGLETSSFHNGVEPHGRTPKYGTFFFSPKKWGPGGPKCKTASHPIFSTLRGCQMY